MKLNKIVFPIMIIVLLLARVLSASELTIDDVKKKVWRDPYKVAGWLKKNISYVRDKVSYAQTAQETFEKRGGDCEDFAILAQYLLGNTYETYLVIWEGRYKGAGRYGGRSTKASHCICVIKYHDALWVRIDQDELIGVKSTLFYTIKDSGDLSGVDIERAYFVTQGINGKLNRTTEIDLKDCWKVY